MIPNTWANLAASESVCACGAPLNGSHDHWSCGPPIDGDSPDAPTLREAAAKAIEALHDAARDIREWRQLGRQWREESPDYSRDPRCPTDAGMERSEVVLQRIGVALASLRAALAEGGGA